MSQLQLAFDDLHPDYITLGKNAVDITGQTFGRLTTLGPVNRASNRQIMWLCRCDCGNLSTVQGNDLRRLHSLSCGCYNTENQITVHTTHGLSDDPLYETWCHIIGRCYLSADKSYPNYGGRGIIISDMWRHDFQAFYDHVSQLPNFRKKGYTLDRIDNDGDYEPGNVRWATQKEQCRNQRRNRMLSYNGETKCLAEWADDTGISRANLWNRLNLGWTVERTLTQSIRR